MITEKGTSVGDKSSARDRLIINDVTVCLRHNHTYARGLRQGGLRSLRCLLNVKYTNAAYWAYCCDMTYQKTHICTIVHVGSCRTEVTEIELYWSHPCEVVFRLLSLSTGVSLVMVALIFSSYFLSSPYVSLTAFFNTSLELLYFPVVLQSPPTLSRSLLMQFSHRIYGLSRLLLSSTFYSLCQFLIWHSFHKSGPFQDTTHQFLCFNSFTPNSILSSFSFLLPLTFSRCFLFLR